MTETDPVAAVEAAAFAILAADPDALSSGKSFAARLGDRAPSARRENRILMQALADGASLLRTATGDRQFVRAQLVTRLENEHGYRTDLAQWAVSLADRLIHGAGPAVHQPPVTTPESTAAQHAQFVQATPVSWAAVDGTVVTGQPRTGPGGRILSAIAIIACAAAFGIAADGIYVYSVFSTYAHASDQQVEHAIWMLGYTATIGVPFGFLAGMRRPAHAAAAFGLAFLFVALTSDIQAAISRLAVLLPCAALALAAAALARRTSRASLALGATALSAVIAVGLHVVFATLNWGVTADSLFQAPKLASGIVSAGLASIAAASVARFLFRNSRSPKI